MNFNPRMPAPPEEHGAAPSDLGHGDESFDPSQSGPDDFNLVGTGKTRRRISDGTVVLFGVLVIAAGALYGMRWLAGQSTSYAGDAVLESKVNAFLGEGLSTQDLIQGEGALARLTDDRTDAQVPLDETQKNPFIMFWQVRSVQGSNDELEELVIDLGPTPEEIREARRRELESEALSYEVSSIMGGSGSFSAVVDDRVIQVGTLLDGQFRVLRINPMSIILGAEDFEFEVKLDLRH